jgi:hypothetical protein
MNDIAQQIRDSRKIKESTLSTYMRTLKRVHEHCGHEGESFLVAVVLLLLLRLRLLLCFFDAVVPS